MAGTKLYLKLEKLDSSLFYIDIIFKEHKKNSQFILTNLEKNLWLNTQMVELQYEILPFISASLIIKLISASDSGNKILLHDAYLQADSAIQYLINDRPVYKHIQRQDPLYASENLIKGIDIKNQEIDFKLDNNVKHVFNFEKYLLVGTTKVVTIQDTFQIDFKTKL